MKKIKKRIDVSLIALILLFTIFIFAAIFFLVLGAAFGAKLMFSMDPSLAFSGAAGGSAIFLMGLLIGMSAASAWNPRFLRLAVYCGNFAVGSVLFPISSLILKESTDWRTTIVGGLFGFCVANIAVAKK